MKQTILIFGGISIAIFLLFQLSRFSLLSLHSSTDVLLVIAACLFILIGYLINRFLQKRPARLTQSMLNDDPPAGSTLSKREFKILILMSQGLSNIEIAGSLFIAESTVKKHVSNILLKLNAKRRTEAIKIARDLEII